MFARCSSRAVCAGSATSAPAFNMDPSIPTIGDLFKELGYRTAFFSKWHLSFPGEVPSSPEVAEEGPAMSAREARHRRGLLVLRVGLAGRRGRLEERFDEGGIGE